MNLFAQRPSLFPRHFGECRHLLAAAVVPTLVLALSGCALTRTHAVRKINIIPNVQTATLGQLLDRISSDYSSVQSLTATVDITASTGGEHQGEVRQIPTLPGYIVIRKPADLLIQLLVPFVRSQALVMVSDGKDFKLYIPPKGRAVIGSDEMVTDTPKGFENLRPYIIRDAVLIPPLRPDEEIILVNGSRIIEPRPGQKDALEEPDYDLTIVRRKGDQRLAIVRVIHIGRATLRCYEQDIYDSGGNIVTKVAYDKYQHFGDHMFPASILITRPIDEYALQIDLSKMAFNTKVDDDSFLLNIPDGIPIQKMK